MAAWWILRRVGGHLAARRVFACPAHAEIAELGQGHEARGGESGLIRARTLHDHRRPAVTEAERRQLSAENGLHVRHGVLAQRGDVLARDHHPSGDDPSPDEVVHDEHAREHARARVGDVERECLLRAYGLFHIEREGRLVHEVEPVFELGDGAADDHLQIRRLVNGVPQAFPGRVHGQRIRIFALGAYAALADAGVAFQVDAPTRLHPCHQILGGEAFLRERRADALEARSEQRGGRFSLCWGGWEHEDAEYPVPRNSTRVRQTFDPVAEWSGTMRPLLRSISGQPATWGGRAFEGSRDAVAGSRTIGLTSMSGATRGWP